MKTPSTPGWVAPHPREGHYHHCGYANHPYPCPTTPYWKCFLHESDRTECADCVTRRLTVASLVYPAVCDRCGLWKRAEDGRALYVTFQWKMGKRIVCPTCQETERVLRDLGKLTGATDMLDEEIPF